MSSPLTNAVEFLRAFGFFDVVVPFILVFTIVFGILEKTKIFGTEKRNGDDASPRTNLNSMVAFAIAFLVIAATKIVEIIQLSLPQIMLILVIIIAFLLLVGTFMGDKAGKFHESFPNMSKFLIVLVFIAIVLIFLNIFGVLTPTVNTTKSFFSGAAGGSVILLIIALAAIWFVMKRPEEAGKKTEK